MCKRRGTARSEVDPTRKQAVGERRVDGRDCIGGEQTEKEGGGKRGGSYRKNGSGVSESAGVDVQRTWLRRVCEYSGPRKKIVDWHGLAWTGMDCPALPCPGLGYL